MISSLKIELGSRKNLLNFQRNQITIPEFIYFTQVITFVKLHLAVV